MLNIIDFAERLIPLGRGGLSLAQRVCLKAIYGLSLEPQELEVYRRASARDVYVPREQNEATVIVGRRGGKTSRIASLIAIYEAFRGHALAPGERGYVLLIAPVTKQAQIAFNYIKSYILGSPVLAQAVAKICKSEIELRNGIVIACYPCSYITVRGVSVVCAICDEMAFWRHEETAANPEQEVIAALRPAMATFPTAKLLKISTPFAKEGILWRDLQERAALDYLVWQLPSPEMNPSLQSSFLESERRRSEENYRREFLAEFTDSIAGWIAVEVLEACVVRGRRDLPRVETGTYLAAIDPGFKRSDFVMAILHRDRNGRFVVDRLARWTGTKQAPVPFERACETIKDILAEYKLNCAVGDQFCDEIIKQHFDKPGISYKEVAFTREIRAKLFHPFTTSAAAAEDRAPR